MRVVRFVLRWTGRALALLLIGLMSVGLAGTLGRMGKAPPYEMVEVEPGRALHVMCEGPQDARFVLYDAGMFGIYADGWWVKEHLKADFRVCLYDRAGLGWSNPVPEGTRPSSLWHVEEMRRLMDALGVQKPAYLVGHSAAGLRLHAFANVYPDELAGLVFVDAASPTGRASPRFRRLISMVTGVMHVSAASARVGIAGGIGRFLPDELALPEQPLKDKRRSVASVRHHKGTLAEIKGFEIEADYYKGTNASGIPMSVVNASETIGVNGQHAKTALEMAGFGRVHLLPDESHVSVLNETHARLIAEDIREMEALRSIKNDDAGAVD